MLKVAVIMDVWVSSGGKQRSWQHGVGGWSGKERDFIFTGFYNTF